MRLLSTICCAVLTLLTSAQGDGKQVEHQKLIWFGYLGNVRFNERWSLTLDLQERRFIQPSAQHQLVMRSYVHRNIGSGWDVASGMCMFLNSPNDPLSTSDLLLPELRPHIEFNHKQKTGVLQVNHRYRVEARFFHNIENNELGEGYTFAAFRFRYRIGVDWPLWKVKEGERGPLTLRASDEIMINVGDKVINNAFDQNRIAIGLLAPVSRTTSMEFGYINWFQQRASGVEYYDRQILRFIIVHKIDLGRKATTDP